ncbi:unnamed protein product [Chilo suppressalis]|uniref:Uncharacterized protein n=1 Tax=Chilo suppressalis TaxID=168631 RepID=A0ABN8B1T8_CHISP|nr:unnamed protein product [Chilo suppressalis]
MERSRKILQSPARGKHCRSLVQRRACLEHHGYSAESDKPLKAETAMILPGELSVSRHSNETVDISKNLRLRNPDDPESNSHRDDVEAMLLGKSDSSSKLVVPTPTPMEVDNTDMSNLIDDVVQLNAIQVKQHLTKIKQ